MLTEYDPQFIFILCIENQQIYKNVIEETNKTKTILKATY